MPPGVIAQALAELEEIGDWLDSALETVVAQRASLEKRLESPEPRAQTKRLPIWSMVTELAAQMAHLTEFQTREIEAWQVQVETVRKALDQGMQTARQRSLTEHRGPAFFGGGWGVDWPA